MLHSTQKRKPRAHHKTEADLTRNENQRGKPTKPHLSCEMTCKREQRAVSSTNRI